MRKSGAVALLAACSSLMLLSGCFAPNAATEAEFTEKSVEPTGIAMPKFSSPDIPSQPVPTTTTQAPSNGPCQRDDIILAACLPLTTALAPVGTAQALVATADGALTLVRPGVDPVELTRLEVPVRQLLPSPAVTEDGQVFALGVNGTITRITLLPDAAGVDVRPLPELSEPETVAIYFDTPSQPQELRKILRGDPNIEIVNFCSGLNRSVPLATAYIEGSPMLVELTDGIFGPLGGVDFSDSIGGCTIVGDQVVVAIPDAQKVISVPMKVEYSGRYPFWKLAGNPEVLVEKDFGRISHVAAVVGEKGVEVWGATTNKSGDAPAAAADERVVRLPLDAASGASPA